MTHTLRLVCAGSVLLSPIAVLNAQIPPIPSAVSFVSMPMDAPTSPRPVSFARTPPVLTPAGAQGGPIGTAFGDFNNDGILDIAAVADGSIYVYLGNGDGTFKAPKVTSLNGFFAGTAAVGDFNSDHKADLVVASNQNSPVALMLGNGDGTFKAPLNIASGDLPTVGDFNGDKKLDIALRTYAGLQVLLGNGAGGFTPMPTIQASWVGGIAAGDLNGDHKLDLAVSDSMSNMVSIYLGNGDGTFGYPGMVTVGSIPGSIAIHDLNGDGIADIAVADTRSSDVAVLLGNGNGTFQLPTMFAVPSATGDLNSLVVGDFNNDGIPDIAVLGYLLLGSGGGKFQPAISYPLSNTGNSVIAADLNGDHKLDLVVSVSVSFFGPQSVSVLLGKGNGAFRGAPDLAVGPNPKSIAVADFNNDGKPDIIAANLNSLSVALGNGKGSFSAPVSVFLSVWPSLVVTGDFNNDGNTDVIVGSYGLPGGYILLGNGTGGFQAPMPISFSGITNAIVVGDFNKDGKLDIAVSVFYDIYVLLGNGDGTFQAPITTAVSNDVQSLAAGDLNGDGNLDLAIGVTYPGAAVAILLGNGDGTFTADATLSAYYGALSVLIADLNGDGKLDVSAAGNGNVSGGASIYLGRGDGTFEVEQTYPGLLAIQAGGLVAGDFNLDGKMDLAMLSSNSVSIMLGNGDGSFNVPQIFGVESDLLPCCGPPVGAVAKGFFNILNNKKLGLVVANGGSNDVSILINNTK